MSIKDFLISCLFPKRCLICGEVINYNDEVCGCCIDSFDLNNIVHYIPYRESDKVYKCFSPFVYRGKVREVILKFKFNHYIECADFFSREIAKTIYAKCDVIGVDYICYVPMTKKSFSERGYNQSEILAKSIGKVMHIPVRDVLVKTRETLVQHSLVAKDRERNLSSAFSVCEGIDIRGKNFILCDDIVTTGYTLRECIKELKKAGAKDVICCTIAAPAH